VQAAATDELNGQQFAADVRAGFHVQSILQRYVTVELGD